VCEYYAFYFTESLTQIAVDTHNVARRTVDPTSADMREMSWDDELADLALSYSQQCVYRHNPVSLQYFYSSP